MLFLVGIFTKRLMEIKVCKRDERKKCFKKWWHQQIFMNHWCAITNTPPSSNINAPDYTINLQKWKNQILPICCIRFYSYNFSVSICHVHLQNFTLFHKVPLMVHYKIHHHKIKMRNLEDMEDFDLIKILKFWLKLEGFGFMMLINDDWWMLGFLMGLAFQSLSWIWILEELLTFKSGDLRGWLLKLGKYGSCKVCLMQS